ncbi:hypothetical protein ILUMI_25313, partial [Ignelater luminosus]
MLDNIKEVTVFPPVNVCGNITNEDFGYEEVVQIDNLPVSRLRAPAEIKVVVPQTEDDFSSDDDLPLSNFTKFFRWNRLSLKSSLEYFYDFFDDSIIGTIVRETNKYAQQRNRTQTVTDNEIRAFIGVLILSGYVPVPRRKMVRERERDAHNKLSSSPLSYAVVECHRRSRRRIRRKRVVSGFYATGTVRENRLPRSPLVDSKQFRKEDCGSYDFKKISDQNIIVVKWNDNSLVPLCSNYAGIEPIHNVKRYSQKKRQNVQ